MVLKNYLFSEQHSSSINNMLSFPLHDVGYIVMQHHFYQAKLESILMDYFSKKQTY